MINLPTSLIDTFKNDGININDYHYFEMVFCVDDVVTLDAWTLAKLFNLDHLIAQNECFLLKNPVTLYTYGFMADSLSKSTYTVMSQNYDIDNERIFSSKYGKNNVIVFCPTNETQSRQKKVIKFFKNYDLMTFSKLLSVNTFNELKVF